MVYSCGFNEPGYLSALTQTIHSSPGLYPCCTLLLGHLVSPLNSLYNKGVPFLSSLGKDLQFFCHAMMPFNCVCGFSGCTDFNFRSQASCRLDSCLQDIFKEAFPSQGLEKYFPTYFSSFMFLVSCFIHLGLIFV